MEKEKKSRTQLKIDALGLQKLGEKLTQLTDNQLDSMELPEELHAAVGFAKTITKHGALRRQLQYIGSLMRFIDPVPIERAIMEIEQGAYQKAIQFQMLEKWRDGLIAGEDGMMEEVLEACSGADRQRLGQIVRSARREKMKNNSPKSSRKLFKYLREIFEGN